ncbi:hypothetical protein YPS_3556 [Yersinia pestis Pestoides A]|nr:hypothetical protein YPS_3556 [Yersinia pestis Pestoides A]
MPPSKTKLFFKTTKISDKKISTANSGYFLSLFFKHIVRLQHQSNKPGHHFKRIVLTECLPDDVIQ